MSAQSGAQSRPEEIPLEAVPIVCEGITLENLSLDAREGFLLSRLDGHTNLKQLFLLCGLGEEETLKLLRQLQAKQVVIWRLPKAPKEPAAAAEARAKPAPTSWKRPESEAEFASQVDDLFRRLEYVTLYELLGVDTGAGSKAVKKAYLQRSKSFHPDRHFRRGDPKFRHQLQEIFKRINLAYKELSDPVRRGEYDAELRKQDASKGGLDLAWEERRVEPEAAPPPPPPGPKLKLDFGKSALERQIEAKLKEMEKHPEGQSRFAQAARLYQGALAEMSKKNLKAAGINLKLAIQYDPQNPTYRAEMERLSQLESSMQAEIAFEQGVEAEEEGDPTKAIKLYGAALKIHPDRTDWLYRLAKLVLEHQRSYERARTLILKAIELKKGNSDFHFLLGQAYEGLEQKQPAIIQFEKTLELNPKHKSAAKELKALRKK